MRGTEFEFDTRPSAIGPNITLIEGLSFARANFICDRASYRHKISVPMLSRMSNDRFVKKALFSGVTGARDALAETMGTLANRRVCYVDAIQHRSSLRPTLIRMHLLSSYSALRDNSVSLSKWIQLVRVAFGDVMPKRVIMLDHRLQNGVFDPHQVDKVSRDLDQVKYDCARRYDALKALAEEFDMQVLNIPAGLPRNEDVNRAIKFINSEPYL